MDPQQRVVLEVGGWLRGLRGECLRLQGVLLGFGALGYGGERQGT